MRQNWANKTLADVISPAKVCKNTRGEDYPILSITMRSGIVFQKDRFSKQIASVDTSTYKVVNNGQLVIAFPIDEGLIYTQDIVEKGIMSPAYNIWDVDYSNLDRRFLVTYLHSDFAMNYYKSKLKGTTQRRRALPKDDLLSMPLPVPPLTTQQSIVSELDTLSQIIADYKEQLADYDKLEQSIFYDMFGDPVKNEKGWEVKKLGEVVEYTSLGIVKSGEQQNLSNQFIYFKMNNIGEKGHMNMSKITRVDANSDEVQKYKLHEGDFLFNTRNSFDLVGKTCIFHEIDEIVLFNNNIIRLNFEQEICNSYVNALFQDFYIKNQLDLIKKGTTSVWAIYYKDLKEINILVPPFSLQQQFASKIESIEQMKADTKAALQDAELLFQSRMDYYFNG